MSDAQVTANGVEWAMQDSNLRPLACRARAPCGITPPAAADPGCVLRGGEPVSEYHADREYVSSSLLAAWWRGGPAAYRAAYLRPHDDSSATTSLERGTLVHLCLEIGPAEFWRRVTAVPSEHLTDSGAISSGKAATAWRRSLPPDAIPLPDAVSLSISDQIAEIYRNSAARELIEQSIWREWSVRWTTEEGHRLRCRFDMATPEVWCDVKTTREASPLRRWHRSVREFFYGHQSAVYRMGMRAAGWPDSPIRYLLTSTVPPYTCHVATLPERYVADCTREVTAALDEIALRTEADWWLPDGYGQVHELWMPGYSEETRA